MSTRWALRMMAADSPAAGALRLEPGIEACAHDDHIWLRGDSLSDELSAKLARIPGEHFTLADDGLIIPRDSILPIGKLPEKQWVPLRQWIAPTISTAALPGANSHRMQLILVRSVKEITPTLLLTAIDAWLRYANHAPAIRLRRLKFAVSSSQALLYGHPLPALPGTRYVENSGIAVPCGFTITPAIDASVLIRLLGLSKGDLALFAPDGSYQLVKAAEFMAAGRSAARLSAQAVTP